MVFASIRVVANRRLAAGPVGADKAQRTFFARRIFRIALTIVVLPTPGPPVITSARFVSAWVTASRWVGASDMPALPSNHSSALGTSIVGYRDVDFASPRRSVAT